MDNNIKEIKANLRLDLLKRLQAFSETYITASNKDIIQHVLATKAFKKAGTVFCFVGVGREIDTLPILQAAFEAGKRVTVPKCIGKGVMVACEIKAVSELIKNKFGLMEPTDDYQAIPRSMIDFAVIPCLACDLQGYRLGWGGGYYDRYLAESHFHKAVICRELMLEPIVPHDGNDIPIELIITEKGSYPKSKVDNG